MITVSSQFKNAIKNPERKIKGYVETIYDYLNIPVTINTDIDSDYMDSSEITDGIRVTKDYGTLDYLPLDGSYSVMNREYNPNCDFISNLNAGQLIRVGLGHVNLSFSQQTLKGFTIYFKNNGIKRFTYTLSDNVTVEENYIEPKNIVQVIFNNPKTTSKIDLEFLEFEYEDRKVRIEEIDLGITQVYKDQDLIEFTVDEEVNKLVEEVPINETNITLNNMSNLFNPLNPTGIVPYLSDNSLIKPYVGILTEDFGVEYVKMGEFYFESYTNNSDATTTLVGKNIIRNLEKETFRNENEIDIFDTSLNEAKFRSFMQNYNYSINSLVWSDSVPSYFIKNNNLLEFLKEMTFHQRNIIYANRNNSLNFKPINSNIVDTLTKTELINDINYKKIDKINTVKLTTPRISSNNIEDERDVLTIDVVLSKSPEIFLIQAEQPTLALADVSQTGGSSISVISQGWYMTFVKITGTVGSTVRIKFRDSHEQKEYITTQEMNDGTTPKYILEFNSYMNYYPNNYINNSNILNITPSYETNFEYNGDPSLEAGDYINVETPYGYKQLFIQKNRIKFDGGLEGSIEGVE